MKSCRSFSTFLAVVSALLQLVSGAAINPPYHDIGKRVADDSSTFPTNSSDPISTNSTNGTVLPGNAITVATNLLKGFNTFCAAYGGSKIEYIEATAPVGGVSRDHPEDCIYIKMSFRLPDTRRGSIASDPSLWGRWGAPTINSRDRGGGSLPFEPSNIKIPINTAIGKVNRLRYWGKSKKYWINTSGLDPHGPSTGLSYKFWIGQWLATVDAVSGDLLEVVKAPFKTDDYASTEYYTDDYASS